MSTPDLNNDSDRYDYAYYQGVNARQAKQGLGLNPFSIEDEKFLYEAWVDGWNGDPGIGTINDRDIGC